jgi:NDP-sugar pyrophosphorylase family protein
MKPEIFEMIPENTYYGIPDLIKDMQKRKMKIGRYLMQEYWLDIGQMTDYEVAQSAYKEHFNQLKDK